MNKLISIEGTDCAGKSTQLSLLMKRLKEANILIESFKFPNYDSPTGEIVGEYYLGRNGKGCFKEGASKVDSKVSALYFAADRKYNIPIVEKMLEKTNVILDRYVDSNIAYSGAKIEDKEERYKIYQFLIDLEYGLLELPKPEIKILLYMPSEFAKILKSGREEKPDELEKDEKYMKNVEKAYLEVAKLLDYKVINCVKDQKIRSIEDINDELFNYVLSKIN